MSGGTGANVQGMHPTTRTSSLLLAAAACAALACGGTPDEKVAGGQTTPQVTLRTTSDTTCPLTGPWQSCSITERLERAGLAPRLLPDTLRDEAFGVPGQRWQVGDATLDVYIYATAEARESATARLDSIAIVRSRSRVATPGAAATPTTPRQAAEQGEASRREAHFVRTANIAAIVANARATAAERILLTITAGQPAR